MSRIKNWSKNYKGYCPKRLLKLKPMMRERLANEFKALEQLENAVKKIMGESGLPTWHNLAYLNFGRQIYGLRKRHIGGTLQREIDLRITLAQQKLLKKSILLKIRDAVLSLPMPSESKRNS